jgi:TolA-binding protein
LEEEKEKLEKEKAEALDAAEVTVTRCADTETELHKKTADLQRMTMKCNEAEAQVTKMREKIAELKHIQNIQNQSGAPRTGSKPAKPPAGQSTGKKGSPGSDNSVASGGYHPSGDAASSASSSDSDVAALPAKPSSSSSVSSFDPDPASSSSSFDPPSAPESSESSDDKTDKVDGERAEPVVSDVSDQEARRRLVAFQEIEQDVEAGVDPNMPGGQIDKPLKQRKDWADRSTRGEAEPGIGTPGNLVLQPVTSSSDSDNPDKIDTNTARIGKQ